MKLGGRAWLKNLGGSSPGKPPLRSAPELNPETTVDNGAHVDLIAAVSKTFKANNTKLV